MKTSSKFIAASFGLLMMALPSIASADVGFWHPADVQSAVLQETATSQPRPSLAYYHRPWACSNRHYRHHHQYMCR
ncbi:MAG: hypothetical protein ABSG46_13070 [Candidatus Binataceae bacterium]|jgi:hypothetical protein